MRTVSTTAFDGDKCKICITWSYSFSFQCCYMFDIKNVCKVGKRAAQKQAQNQQT